MMLLKNLKWVKIPYLLNEMLNSSWVEVCCFRRFFQHVYELCLKVGDGLIRRLVEFAW